MIGKLNKRITIKTINAVSDGYGGFVESLTTIGTYWANIVPLSSSERFENSLNTIRSTYEIRLRKDSVTPTKRQRIEYGSSVFEINSIKEENLDDRYWVLRVTEIG